MPDDDRALRETLGASRPDVVLTERLQQAVPRHSGVGGRKEKREHDPWQDHVRDEADGILGDRHIAGAAREPELLPEDPQRHQAEPEDRRGNAEEDEAHRHAVRSRASPHGRDDADRDADCEPDRRGAGDQEQRPRQALRHEAEYGLVGDVGIAEPGPPVLVAPDKVSDEPPELLVPRLVEAEALPDECKGIRRGRLSGESKRRIAGRQEVEDREREQQYDEDDDDRPRKPAYDVEQHRGLRAGGAPRSGAPPVRSFRLGRFQRYVAEPSETVGLVERPRCNVRAEHVQLVTPEIRDPRHHLRRELTIECCVARRPRFRGSCAADDARVDRGHAGGVTCHLQRLGLCGREAEEGVVRVAGRDDVLAEEQRLEERHRVRVVLAPARTLRDRSVVGDRLDDRVGAVHRADLEGDSDLRRARFQVLSPLISSGTYYWSGFIAMKNN